MPSLSKKQNNRKKGISTIKTEEHTIAGKQLKEITYTQTEIEHSEFLQGLIKQQMSDSFHLQNRELDIEEKYQSNDHKENITGMWMSYSIFIVIISVTILFAYLGEDIKAIGFAIGGMLIFAGGKVFSRMGNDTHGKNK